LKFSVFLVRFNDFFQLDGATSKLFFGGKSDLPTNQKVTFADFETKNAI